MSSKSSDEVDRLRALRALDVLDSEADDEFTGLVEAAALACSIPTALITLVDEDRQWFKAGTGLSAIGMAGISETPLSSSFCTHTIRKSDVFEIRDTTLDSRFRDHPLVTGEPRVRFYAGAPLRLDSGLQVGALCVLGREPGQLNDSQRRLLKLLAVTTARALDTRQNMKALAITSASFRALSECSPLGMFRTDATGACTFVNDRWESIFGMCQDDALEYGWCRSLHPDDRQSVFDEWRRCATRQLDFDKEFRILHDDGTVLHVHGVSRPMIDDGGEILGHIGSIEDVSVRKAQEVALAHSRQLLDETGALADVGGWDMDIASRHLHWTDQTFRIHGLSPVKTAFAGRCDQLSTHPKRVPLSRMTWIRRSTAGAAGIWSFHFVAPMVCRTGCAPSDTSSSRTASRFDCSAPLQNITQQVSQRRALESAHKRISVATNNARIGVWEWDVGNGALYWTPQMYALHGQPIGPEMVTYEHWARCIHPQDRSAAERDLKNALTGTAGIDTEFRVLWADGSVHHLCSSGHITRDAQGKALKVLGVNWDVTELRQVSADLAKQHELLRVTLQSIGDAVITTDADANVTWMNPVAEGLTGWISSEAVGRSLNQVFHILNEGTRLPVASPVDNSLRLDQAVELAHNTMLISRDGRETSIEDSTAPIHDQHGATLGAVLVFHDVTEKRRLVAEMSYRATHDALTGLINRSEFDVRLQRALEHAHDNQCVSALMYIDLDQFKLVNDACGHSAGDQLLVQMSKLLGAAIRTGDIVARLGGDEFGVILRDCNGAQAQRVAQTICDRMDEFRFDHDGRRFRIGTSIGLVPLDCRWPDKEALMQAADVSCYAAKEAGRNRVHLWFDTDEIMRARQGDMQWAARLEQALDENRFELHLQRIEPLCEATIGLHAEVLVRLRDVDGSLVLPGRFLPAAERYQLATRLDRFVLKNAIELLVPHASTAKVDMLFINLSGQSIGDRMFHRQAIEMLTAAGEEICQSICLEITETAAVTNIADATVFIEQLHALGVRFALDDFGAGASSFGYLKMLQVDLLKIDGQYITDLIDDPLDDAAVRSFVEVARIMGLKTVAECVESPAILERIRDIGIDFAQGFLLHRPEQASRVLIDCENLSASEP